MVCALITDTKNTTQTLPIVSPGTNKHNGLMTKILLPDSHNTYFSVQTLSPSADSNKGENYIHNIILSKV
jgi:hypothetical protein